MLTIVCLLIAACMIPALLELARFFFSRNGEDLSPVWRSLWPGLLAAALLVLAYNLSTPVTEFWFFQSLGQGGVYLSYIAWKFAMFFGAASLTFLLSYLGTYPLVKSAERIILTAEKSDQFDTLNAIGNLRKFLGFLVPALSIVVGCFAVSFWMEFAFAFWIPSVGDVDPIFGHDMSSYLGTLPVVDAIFRLLVGVLIPISVIRLCLQCYIWESVNARGIESGDDHPLAVLRSMCFHKAFIFRLGAVWMLFFAGVLMLVRYTTLYSTFGKVVGVSAADMYARLPTLSIQIVACLIVASFLLFKSLRPYRKDWRELRLWVSGFVVLFLLLFVYPFSYQALAVNPKRFEAEKPFVVNNIRYTQKAYGIGSYKDVISSPRPFKQEDIGRYRESLENVRIHDPRIVEEAFDKFQAIRPLYNFPDVDVNRIVVQGKPRLALLASREIDPIDPARLAEVDRTWESTHLRYTHGYGLCLVLGNEVSDRGLPELRIKDVPPVSNLPGIQVASPQIYFGELTNHYVVVNTSLEEYDFPKGEGNAFNHYDGTGGVQLGGFWSRLVFAARFDDLSLILSSYLKDDSRILWHRSIAERAAVLAPFLKLDSDPYKVIADDGSLHYVIDGYMRSEWFPYSTPFDKDDSNYLSNPVKVTIDAKNGTIRFWVYNAQDPLLAAWMRMAPSLFLQSKDMPADLKASTRYPEELFKVQVAMLSSYHFSPESDEDVQNFFVGEDKWQVPDNVYIETRTKLDPYYLVAQLPGRETTEGLLVQPLTPVNRDNMISWIGVRMDGADYGKLVIYRFPKNLTMTGPMLVEGEINSNQVMQKELGILKRGGSEVVRANLIVLPVGDSVLFVKPIFLRSQTAGFSELFRVVVSDGTRIGWGRSVNEGIYDMLGIRQTTEVSDVATSSKACSLDLPRDQLLDYLAKLGQGDPVGAGNTLKDLMEVLGAKPVTKPVTTD